MLSFFIFLLNSFCKFLILCYTTSENIKRKAEFQMKNNLKKWLFRGFVGAMSIFSIASLTTGFVQLKHDLSLQTAHISGDLASSGGGAIPLLVV